MRKTRLISLQLAFCAFVAGIAQAQAPDGATVYRDKCATCHEAGVPRAANRAALSLMSADSIRLALTNGKMSTQGAELSGDQRRTTATECIEDNVSGV